MTTSNVKQNLIPNEPELKDLLNLHQKGIFLSMNCHHVATIQTFNPLNQTATATINYTKTYFQPDATGVYQAVQQNYPLLVDSPVICLGGGNGALTFPVAPGDECLVFFNDRDIDNWFQGNTGAAVATPRLHSFSDGIILVGLRSTPNVLVSYSTDSIELRTKTGNAKLAIKEDGSSLKGTVAAGTSIEITSGGKLKITNPSGDFMAMLVQLLTDIQTGTVTTALGEQLLKMPTFPVDLALLETFKA